jgi:hypothetical protein
VKKNYIKIFGGIVLGIGLILLYSVAVTQTSASNHTAEKNTGTPGTDTTDIGEPTGDDPWHELDNLVKTYYPKSGISYEGLVKLYDGNGDSDKLLEEKKFEYTYFNDEYSYTFSPLEVINKKNYTVIVNHDEKLIAVAPKHTAKKKHHDFLDLADFRKIMEQQKANITVTKRGEEKILTIDSLQDPDIQGYRIYYSPGTYQINKVLVGMVRLYSLDEESDNEQIKEKPKYKNPDNMDEVNEYVYYLEINYSVTKPLLLKPGEFNPENKFVRIDGKKIELAPEFKAYELFNSDQQ